MKVYIVLDCYQCDYADAGQEIVGVYDDRNKAFAKMKKLLPCSRRYRAKEDAQEWAISDEGSMHCWAELAEYEVE